jgi:hypothetical protein
MAGSEVEVPQAVVRAAWDAAATFAREANRTGGVWRAARDDRYPQHHPGYFFFASR